MWRTCSIWDAKYQKSDVSIFTSESKNLNSDEQGMLYKILTKYEFLSDRTLETWKTKPVDIEIHPEKKPKIQNHTQCHAHMKTHWGEKYNGCEN